MYMLNFPKYTEWPASYKQGEFVIGIVGDDDLAKNLETAAKTKKINSQTLVVKRFSDPSQVSKCHMLYVEGSANDVAPYASKINSFNCLLVTEGAGLAENVSAINFVVVGAAMKFEMNKKQFDKKDLTVASSLEKLATKVIN